jgi:GAF domain-containing protein
MKITGVDCVNNEEIIAMLKLFARQLEIAAELKQIKEETK